MTPLITSLYASKIGASFSTATLATPMNAFVHRVAGPLAAIAILWLVACAVISFGVAAVFGEFRAERFMPFGNAHLLEDAYQGSFVPIFDPAFLVLAISAGIFVFGGGTYFAVRGAKRNEILYATAPALIAIGSLAWLHRYVWNGDYPLAMLHGAIFQLGVFVVASSAGLLLAVRHDASAASKGG